MKEFKASNFKGKCLIDEDFEPYLIKTNEVLKELEFVLIVTSSYRKDTNVKGAIVTPATKSNHLIGHAIDSNLQDKKTGEYFNSKKMADNVGNDDTIIHRIIKESGLRWGGNFKTRDVVHFDDGLNVTNPKLWEEKYRKIHY